MSRPVHWRRSDPRGPTERERPTSNLIRKGGGDEDVIIFFSLRPYDEQAPIYEVLDDNLDTVSTMNFAALRDLYVSGAA